jgi:hypothetical protein
VIRYVCLSDLHLGAPNSLLSHVPPGADDVDTSEASAVLAHVVACLDDLLERTNDPGDRPTLVLNGDILELALADDDEAIGTFDQFVRVALADRRRFDRVVYLPGNHDHHLWETSREEAYARHVAARPAGAPIARAWHASAIWLDEPDDDPPGSEDGAVVPRFRSSLLDAVVHRVAGLADLDIEVRYPLVGLRSPGSEREVLIHHGHFVEGVYELMSEIRQAGFPASPPPRTMADIEAENFAWIDYFWSTLGRSAAVGRDVSFMYNMVQDRDAMLTMAANFSRPAAARLPTWLVGRRWLARRAFRAIAAHVMDLERTRPADAPVREQERRIRRLLDGPLAAAVGATPDQPYPAPVTFLYGHTHKPYGRTFDSEAFERPVTVHNTGGWVVDEVLPEAGLGGSAVLLDDQLRAVRLDLFRQTPGNHVEPAAFAAVDAGDPFLAELSAAVDLEAEPWVRLREVAGVTMLERQRMVKRIIREGVRQAQLPPLR